MFFGVVKSIIGHKPTNRIIVYTFCEKLQFIPKEQKRSIITVLHHYNI